VQLSQDELGGVLEYAAVRVSRSLYFRGSRVNRKNVTPIEMVLGYYKPIVLVGGIAVAVEFFQAGRERETLTFGGERHEHMGFHHCLVLRGR